jgi:hypothetical protein
MTAAANEPPGESSEDQAVESEAHSDDVVAAPASARASERQIAETDTEAAESEVELGTDLVEKVPAPTDDELARQHEEQKLRRKKAQAAAEEYDVNLRKWVATGALLVMVVQIGLADAGFYLYAHNNHWQIHSAGIEVWLAATVVQVISVVVIITKYLFPAGGPQRDDD